MRSSPQGDFTVRFATQEEISEWDDLLKNSAKGGEVWASTAYLTSKKVNRYKPLYVMVERSDGHKTPVGILTKRVPLLGSWWAVSAGPEAETAAEVLAITNALKDFAAQNGAFLLKIEPRVKQSEESLFLKSGFTKAPRMIPNDSTVIVNLEPEEDAILAGFAKKTRNSISRARREGAAIERVPATDENCAEMFRLLSETSTGRFVLRPREYYYTFWKTFSKANAGQLFFVKKDDDVLAGAFSMILGEKSTYKDGASVRDRRVYGASHILQWEVMRWAKEVGAKTHDLCGAPPSDRQDDKTHPLHGVGKFKQSFEKEIIDYVGALDVPLSNLKYKIWKSFGDRIARRASLFFKKDPYY